MSEHVHDAVIIGAGFAGLCMAIKMQEAGLDDIVLLEKGDDVGGTWRVNRYPGCACDIQSHLYSFSFAQNPSWSRKFPPQGEIWDYLRDVTERYDLRKYIRFGTQVTRAAWQEDDAVWRVETNNGDVLLGRALVSGIGTLHIPKVPELAGRERFKGKTFHSAEWDVDFDFTGKRVAVVGTGASAIQFVPEIAPKVADLYLFQRTAPWVVPRPDRAFSGFEKLLFRTPAKWLYRWFLYWTTEVRACGFLMWPRVLKVGQHLALRHMRDQVADPDLQQKLEPTFTLGCKRVLISNDYYPALSRDNVHLVTDPIASLSERGVVTEDGTERSVDAVIYGTGFKVNDLGGLEVFGRGGRRLTNDEAYLGTVVAGFPNLFTLTGANTGLGHNSIVFMIEAQVRYVVACLQHMRRTGKKRLAVEPAVQAAYNARLQERLGTTVWASGCNSWYLNDEGKNVVLWPSFTFEYWWRTRRPNFALFDHEAAASTGADRPAETAGATPG